MESTCKTVKNIVQLSCEPTKHVSHITFRADMKTLNILYQALIEPKLENGNNIYILTTKSILNSLTPVCNKALGVAKEAFRKLSI